MKSLIFTILITGCVFMAKAQQPSDSLEVEAILEEIFTVCNSVSPEGENSGMVIFERLSKYILYSGSEISRRDKTACDYNKAEDHKIVDETGKKIKSWLDNIQSYKKVKYSLKKEGSVSKHIILLSYQLDKTDKEISFTFLKINNLFLLSEMK